MTHYYFYKNDDPNKEKTTAKAAREAAQEKYAHFRTDDIGAADCVIVFGGDGTMLGALKKMAKWKREQHDPNAQIPNVLGLNYGDVGALMNKPVTEFESLIASATRVEVHPLEAEIEDTQHQTYLRDAFNEVVVHRNSFSGQSCHLAITSPGTKPIYDVTKGDGIIISTPIGSTAYYYDAGGTPFKTDHIGIQPICDRAATERIAGIYPATQEVQINVLNSNLKRPSYANTDNDDRIDNITQCVVRKNKDIMVPLLFGARTRD